MKQTLGGLFDSVKKLMLKTFHALKQLYKEKAPAFMKDQKGQIQLSLFGLPDVARKEAFELRGQRWTQGDKKPVQQGFDYAQPPAAAVTQQAKSEAKDVKELQQGGEQAGGQSVAAEPAATRKSQPDADQKYLDDVSQRFEEKFKDAIFEIDEAEQKKNLQEGYYVIDRIPQEAERAMLKGKLGAAARIAGRSGGSNIADAGQGKAAGETAYQVKVNQAKALTAWAKEHDLLIDPVEFNRQWKRLEVEGAEHQVYFTKDKRVIKRISPSFTTWSDYFNRVALQNWLFPDTAYTLSGFMLDAGRLYAVVEQPFIEQHASQPVTDEDIFNDTGKVLGFTYKSSKGMSGNLAKDQDFYHPDGIVMTDLHDKNVFRNYAGSLRYIDAIIWMDYATKYQRLAERYGIPATSGPSTTSKKTETAKPVDPAPTTKLQDFGEKLGGARKDFATKFADAKNLDLATEPFSKTWPEPDYKKMLQQGFSTEDVALVRAIRDEIPDKPRKSYKVAAWAKLVTELAGNPLLNQTACFIR